VSENNQDIGTGYFRSWLKSAMQVTYFWLVLLIKSQFFKVYSTIQICNVQNKEE